MRIITNMNTNDPAATGPGPLPLPTPEIDGIIGDEDNGNTGCTCPTGGTGSTGSTGGENTTPEVSCPYPPLSMVYSPAQSWGGLFEPDQALQQGTLFRCLDKPFTGKGAK